MISQGTAASISLTVTEQDTAIVLGSGDVAVLGTPRVVALCEEAAVAALAGFLPDGATTVGTSISIYGNTFCHDSSISSGWCFYKKREQKLWTYLLKMWP